MKRTHVMIGLASLVGAALLASPAAALNAFSPTGHLNVRSGPGFQYPVVAQMQQNVPAAVTGCIQDYSWCSVATGGVTGWASAPYLVCRRQAHQSASVERSARHSDRRADRRRRRRRYASGRRHGRGSTHRRGPADPAGA